MLGEVFSGVGTGKTMTHTAVKVAGRKKMVMAAITRMTALSLDVAIATACDVFASCVLVAARLRLVAESRCAMPLYT